MAVTEIFDNTELTDDTHNSYIKPSYYYDLDEFRNLMEKYSADTNLSILDINARSLVKHFNELTSILSDWTPLDLITIQESWLDDTLVPLVKMEGYSMEYKHKQSKN